MTLAPLLAGFNARTADWAVVSEHGARCSRAGTTVVCAIGRLAPRHRVRVVVPLRFAGSGSQRAIAFVRDDEVEGAPGDARAAVKVTVAG